MTEHAQSAALFDLDKTLIDVSSASLWFRHEWRAGHLPLSYAARVPLWMIQYSLGIGSLDWIFTQAFALMKGQEHPIIERQVREWFEAEVRDHIRPGGLDAIARHRAAGDRLVVATGSSNYAADLAIEAYGLDEAICTRLELAEGRLTGRVDSAMGEYKCVRAEEWSAAGGIPLARCTFYTDSITDLPLLERVGHPVAVNPQNRLRRVAEARGWPIVDWRTAALRRSP